MTHGQSADWLRRNSIMRGSRRWTAIAHLTSWLLFFGRPLSFRVALPGPWHAGSMGGSSCQGAVEPGLYARPSDWVQRNHSKHPGPSRPFQALPGPPAVSTTGARFGRSQQSGDALDQAVVIRVSNAESGHSTVAMIPIDREE